MSVSRERPAAYGRSPTGWQGSFREQKYRGHWRCDRNRPAGDVAHEKKQSQRGRIVGGHAQGIAPERGGGREAAGRCSGRATRSRATRPRHRRWHTRVRSGYATGRLRARSHCASPRRRNRRWQSGLAYARWSLTFRSRSPRQCHVYASIVLRHPGGRNPILGAGLQVHDDGDCSCEAVADQAAGAEMPRQCRSAGPSWSTRADRRRQCSRSPRNRRCPSSAIRPSRVQRRWSSGCGW